MLFWVVLGLGTVWGSVAVWVQFPAARWVVLAFGAAILAVIWARVATDWGWAALLTLSVVVGGWYLSLQPRLDRDWAPDVARIVTADVGGDTVTLHNIRAFRWTDPDHAAEHWVERQVDLHKLASADMITSVWDNPEIAHLLVSFGFDDGQRIVFSVEIRKERGEKFSSVGGFFRQFELALIAADEEDIVKLRTHYRGEDVRLYHLRLTPEQLRVMFLQYLELGNEIAENPRFYNTVTTNCTTVVWQLSKALKPDLGLDMSLLLSGRLPEYLHRLGVLEGAGTLDEIRAAARISERARAAPEGADFSAVIRAGR
ncbi:DUF4105 domain-containing protein [Gemmobacter aquatilis]|uniref:Lnb N-terminal periplasmic domain-containing protein n=1 Tax=Gemmobacter aquatilis TaxID=933059 RepID=UPI001FE173B5|nr:DUF4105 domain-containing protein [Gemmobacter aquatilis]